jgi:hydroxypyruvate reductase
MSLKGRVPFDPRRDLLLELFRVALAAVDGRRRVRAALAGREGTGPVSAFAVGKAAGSMMLGAADALGARLARGLVVAPDGAVPPALAGRPGMLAHEAGHPRPDHRSLAAGEALLEFAAATPPGSRVLLLVSGGASALLEVPAPGVGLAELVALFERSLREGLDIERLNRERIALSRVKGGRLAGLFQGAAVEALMISDVPRDDVAVLGSGLLDTPGLDRRMAGTLDEALDAVARVAASRGLKVARDAQRLSGDADAAARRICHELAVGDADLHVYGGETVVRLPGLAGRGGRCQHLAVAAAQHIAGHARMILLAAGTDGRDGASEDAGAIVDGGTIGRAQDCGMDPAAALAAADTGTFLEATGDLIHTGPTGTNVGDIVLALRQAPPDPGRM